jgi:moderate conductance mechanosensitive channel
MSLAVAPITDITTWARGSGLEIVLFITGAVVLARVTRSVGSAITGRIDAKTADDAGLIRSESAKHSHVVAQMSMWAIIVLLYCAAAVLTLQRFGVPVTGLVASTAAVGVAIGFGAQRLVQDILAGLFIIAERQYGFGDVVRIAALGSEVGVSGTVEEVTLRVTRLRTVNGEVVIVANGQIVQVTNLSRDWARAVVDVPVPVSADVNRVSEVLRRVCEEAFADPDLHRLMLDAPSVMGVESLEVDQFNVRVVARTLPGKQFDVGRALRARITRALLREGLSVAPAVDADEQAVRSDA